MRVLVTGAGGKIGREILTAVQDAGYEVRTFDRQAKRGGDDWEHVVGDMRDVAAVRRAAQGMDAVVHMAAISHDRYGSQEDIYAVNVLGTLHMLQACLEADIERMVFFSSVNALGCFQGHRLPDYFPVDDAHPRHPMSAYQLSKHLGEEACRSFTEAHGIATICLRPAYVAHPNEYASWAKPFWQERQETTWFKGDYWSYVDIRDVCDATLRALRQENATHDGFLLCATDTMMLKTTAELVDAQYPSVPWRADRADYLAADPHRSLVNCSHALEVLGWLPKHSWREEQ